MPSLATFGDGVTTTFRLPVHNQQATATVGGSAATLASQGPSHVTFATPPALNASVVINYTPPVIIKSGVNLLSQSAAASSVTGVTAETTLASIQIPAGSIGPNGALRVRAKASFNATAGYKTLRVRLAGTQMANLDNAGSATALSLAGLWDIENRGVTNSQIGAPPFTTGVSGQTNNSFQLASIDTSAAQVLTITGQLATASDNMALESFRVEIINP